MCASRAKELLEERIFCQRKHNGRAEKPVCKDVNAILESHPATAMGDIRV